MKLPGPATAIKRGRPPRVVDTTCEPPTTHTLGGTIGHVITFAAVRRTLAAEDAWRASLASVTVADLAAGVERDAGAQTFVRLRGWLADA